MPVLPDIRNDPDVQEADVAIIANVTIKELRFDAVPNPTVEFPGKPKSDTIWHADRYNLPDQVQPGVTYRNVGIRLKIISRFADIDRIVAEALGEIPLQEEIEQKETPQATSDVANKDGVDRRLPSPTPTSAPKSSLPRKRTPNE